MSGLELNADKTELMLLGSQPAEKTYAVTYLEESYNIMSNAKIKINGINFQRDRKLMKLDNVELAMSKMNQALRKWTRRGMSTRVGGAADGAACRRANQSIR